MNDFLGKASGSNKDPMANNPVSSWGYQSESILNSSGTKFSVKFMGYVPLPRSISHRSIQEKDDFVKLCINTVVSSKASETFNNLRLRGEVGPFVSVQELDVFLNISNLTITFFHILEGRTLLLGRYMIDKISHYKRTRDGVYLGIVMINRMNDKRECNVIKLARESVSAEVVAKLQKVDKYEQNTVPTLEARLRSTQDYVYKVQMLACFHGRMTHDEACRRLLNIGDFLIRESASINGEYAISVRTGPNTCDKFIIPANNIEFFKQFQIQDSLLKNAVVRPSH